MQNKLKFPALDADVVIDGANVSIMNGDGKVVQVSAEEWEVLREKWRFDDVVDYKSGETPMTLFQLHICVQLLRQAK